MTLNNTPIYHWTDGQWNVPIRYAEELTNDEYDALDPVS